MTQTFTLHPRLATGSIFLGRSGMCQVLLKDNALFPWLLIVPEVPAAMEDLHQLPEEQYTMVLDLVRRVSVFVSDYFQPAKLNVACIGNQVRQMHLHIVGRSPGDAAWPGTVWASQEKAPWPPSRITEITCAARSALGLSF